MFSEKYGYRPESPIQHEQISQTLRQKIWKLFYEKEKRDNHFFPVDFEQVIKSGQTLEEKIIDRMSYLIGISFKGNYAYDKLRNGILSTFTWFEVYDFIEIYLSFLEEQDRNERTNQYNKILEYGRAGYRIIAGEVVPLINESEMQCIEQAAATSYQTVNEHIKNALSFYANRRSPDYKNSIKESILAVESICCIITGMSGRQATLGVAIKKLKEKGVYIHSAMEKAFSLLYGYTSDEEGIRHGGIDFTNTPSEDAKYMLISCSAFVNYLIEKWEKINSER